MPGGQGTSRLGRMKDAAAAFAPIVIVTVALFVAVAALTFAVQSLNDENTVLRARILELSATVDELRAREVEPGCKGVVR